MNKILQFVTAGDFDWALNNLDNLFKNLKKQHIKYLKVSE
jgi:hypothetical protein